MWDMPLRFLALSALGLGHADRQDALIEVRLDLRGVDLVREPHAILEVPGPTCPSAQCTFTLALLDLSCDRQLVADELDVHVLALDPRELGLEDVGVVLLLDVHER